jgi:branched-chain amino acid transport system ATP-binding protein
MSATDRPAEGAAAAGAPILRLAGVQTHIGAYHILHGVDLDVPAGGVTLLLGRNGAGKTTTLRTIMGLWHPSAGTVSFEGRDIGALSTPEISQLGIAYVPENMGIFAELTVRENLLLAARRARSIDEIDPVRLDAIFDAFPALKKFWEQRAGLLSGGQKQMLAIARAMTEPRKLLLIDEPSKGLAPAIILNLIAALRQLKHTGTTILLVEQNFQFAKRLGDTVAVMDGGRVVHAGGMAELVRTDGAGLAIDRGGMAELVGDEALQSRLLGLSLDSHQ